MAPLSELSRPFAYPAALFAMLLSAMLPLLSFRWRG